MLSSKSSLIIKKIVISSMLLAIALLLPILTAQIQVIGKLISPMHLPVFLCGFLCGPAYGAIVGFTAPLLRYLIFGMPPIMPVGIGMAFELLTYGLVSGLLYKLIKKKNIVSIYISLITAMIAGRFVYGTIMVILMAFNLCKYSLYAFWTGTFVGTWVGIIIQLIVIPPIISMLSRKRLLL